MKKVVFISFCIFAMIMASCNFDSSMNKTKYSIEYDTVYLKTNNSKTYNLFSVSQFDDTVFVYFQTLGSNILNIAKIINGDVFHDNIELPINYFANDYGYVSSICAISNDSLALYQEKRISIFHLRKREIVYKYYHSTYYDTNKIFLQDIRKGIQYNPINKTLLLELVRHDNFDTKKYDADSEFAVELDIERNRINILEPKYPVEFKEETRFHPTAEMFFTHDDSFYMAASGIGRSIIKWNILNNTTSQIKNVELNHSFYKDPLPLTKSDRKNRDILLRTIELSYANTNIIYDKYSGFFLRFFLCEMADLNEENFKTKYSDKMVGMNYFDKNFDKSGELTIGKVNDLSFNSRYFPTSKGIYFYSNHGENYIVIGKLNIYFDE